MILLTVESELTHGNPDGITRHKLQCLHMWCAQQYTVVQIAAGRLQAAVQFLQQVTLLSAHYLYEEGYVLSVFVCLFVC